MTAYYNELDPYAAEWLKALIQADMIAPGDVDSRSILEVEPSDLEGYAQVHLFAGLGGWSYALRMAGWDDETPVWTGSCPCQPFSVAGKRKGTKDERHLWPEFARLIAECSPPVVFGEQVASKAGRSWLAGVQADVEALGYRFGAADLCAAGIGAPHIRQRLWWVADAEPLRRSGWRLNHSSDEESGREEASKRCILRGAASSLGAAGGVADSQSTRQQTRLSDRVRNAVLQRERSPSCDSEHGGLGHADAAGSQGRGILPERTDERSPWEASLDCWLPCGDGKARRIEPSTQPLAHGVPGRVGRLRAYGNAIVPQVAASFVQAYCEARDA